MHPWPDGRQPAMAPAADDDDETQTRVADYLDDKLQTAGDLEALGALLAAIHDQHGLLRQQLDAAQRDLDAAKDAAHAHQTSLVAPRTRAPTDGPSEEAQSRLQTSNEAALAPYRQLRALHTRLTRLQDEAEGAAPQLLYHVDQITRALRTRILDAFSADLNAVLAKIRGPNPKAVIPPQLQEEWETAVAKLLDLQMPELEGSTQSHGPANKTQAPAVLFPFEVLVQPLEMRFRYHFEGDKPTNRIDRPEYFLTHIATLLNDYSGFVTAYMQPLLLKLFRGTDLALTSVYIDATAALITALLPVLRTKIGNLLPKVADQPHLLSHLMHEVMSFDTTIREDWGYDGGFGLEGWRGLAWEFLAQGDWFGRWLQVEKDCMVPVTRHRHCVWMLTRH
jgi:RAD50-interacting protein 1